MPQFTKQTSRPLTVAGYRARTARMTEMLTAIDQYAAAVAGYGPDVIRYRQRLTQSIHGLAHAAKSLSAKHRKLS